MLFLPEAWSAFISLNPCLACYLLLRIPHPSDRNHQFLLCLWIFKFWMDSEGRCIYQFNAWLDRLIINHHCWQLAMWYSVQGPTEPSTLNNTTSSMWGRNRRTCRKSAERRGCMYARDVFPPGYIFTLAEHSIVKCLPLQMAIFLWPCVLVCDTLCH